MFIHINKLLKSMIKIKSEKQPKKNNILHIENKDLRKCRFSIRNHGDKNWNNIFETLKEKTGL